MSLTHRPRRLLKAARDWWQQPVVDAQRASLATAQLALVQQYREALAAGARLPDFPDAGFQVFSDTDEDGLLLHVFTIIGGGGRRLVDIGSASYTASNTANLLLHHGWTGLLVDADPVAVEEARRYYARSPATRSYPPATVHAFVTAENIDELLAANGVAGEIDLLCIDVDGMDMWLWRALEVARPRVVVIEFQDLLGPERSLSVPYDAGFRVTDHAENAELNNYAGASLTAMVKVGREKGYRLVGVNRLGFNAFFVRDGLGAAHLPERTPRECLTHPWNAYGEQVRWPQVRHLEWATI